MSGNPNISELWTSPSVARLFDSSDLGFSLAGVDGVLLDANRTFSNMLGYQREELIGRRVVDITHPDDREMTRESFLNDVRREATHSYEKRYLTKRGEPLWFRIRTTPFRNDKGEVICRIAMMENITGSKQNELNLELMAAIVEQSDDAIFRTTPETIIQYWSRGAELLYGYKAEEVLHNQVSFLFDHEHEPKIKDAHARLMRGEVVTDSAGITKHKDGHLINVSIQLFPLRDALDNTVAFVGVHRDVGELKLLEEQLRHSQRMETAGLLAGGIAHDFNNILTVIQGACSGLVRDIAVDSPEYRYLELIDSAAGKASQLTRQLLAFSRKQPIKLQLLDPAVLLQEFTPMLKQTLGDNIVLQTSFRSAGKIMEDATQLEQIVLNLCINARYSMPHGGVITLATDDLAYSEALLQPGPGRHVLLPLPFTSTRYLRITVSDTGAGMDERVLTRIFEPFFTTKPKGEGTGLGLAVVYGVVSQSGGAIKVESRAGSGSNFQIFLPLAEGDHDSVTAVEAVQGAAGKARILIIEDDADVRALIVASLTDAGYEVLEAANPLDVLEAAMQPEVDLILSDVIMPRMSGPEFAEIWQQTHPAASFLFMSGYFDEARYPDQFIKQGVLLKPFKPAELLARIGQQLSRHKQDSST